jgi:hypothetical protein
MRQIFEQADDHREYARLGFIVAGAMSVFELKRETDSAFAVFQTIALPYVDFDNQARLVSLIVEERTGRKPGKGLTKFLAEQTGGEWQFLTAVLDRTRTTKLPSMHAVKRAVRDLTKVNTPLRPLQQLALHMSADRALCVTVERVAGGSALVRAKDPAADVDRYQMLGAVSVQGASGSRCYGNRNGMTRTFVRNLRGDARHPGQHHALTVLEEVRIHHRYHGAATAFESDRDLKSLCGGYSKMWAQIAYADCEPHLRIALMPPSQAELLWLDSQGGKPVSFPLTWKNKSWLDAGGGAAARNRMYFGFDTDEISIAVPTRHASSFMALVVTIARGAVQSAVSENSLLHWTRFVESQAIVIETMARAEIGRQYLANRSRRADPLSLVQAPLDQTIETECADVFIAMPFTADLDHVYEWLCNAVRKCGLSVRRGDDYFSTKAVMRDVVMAIAHAKLVIADCTLKNPNVFYEVGWSHAWEKEVVLLAQNEDDFPFNIRHLRRYIYRKDDSGRAELESTIGSILEESGLVKFK